MLETVKMYETRPCMIQALKYNGHNCVQVITWMHGECPPDVHTTDRPVINTLEGDLTASVNDYIIKGLNGEFYPCKPDVFHKKYREVENDPN